MSFWQPLKLSIFTKVAIACLLHLFRTVRLTVNMPTCLLIMKNLFEDVVHTTCVHAVHMFLNKVNN